MKAQTQSGNWIVSIGVGGSVVVDSKERADEIERSVFVDTLAGIALAIVAAVVILNFPF